MNEQSTATQAEAAIDSAPFFIRGKVVEGTDRIHRSRDSGVDFATPAIDLNALVHPRTELPPLLNVPLAEIIDFLCETGQRLVAPDNPMSMPAHRPGLWQQAPDADAGQIIRRQSTEGAHGRPLVLPAQTCCSAQPLYSGTSIRRRTPRSGTRRALPTPRKFPCPSVTTIGKRNLLSLIGVFLTPI